MTSKTQNPLQGLRVVVVEDSDELRLFLTVGLSDFGHQVRGWRMARPWMTRWQRRRPMW